MQNNSPKAYYFLGICAYKRHRYKEAQSCNEKALELDDKDSQIHYNMALCNFKLQLYKSAKSHFEECVELDPQHPYAYNNLAFLFNMFQLYGDTVYICSKAKENNKHNHNTHRHWAFAEFKDG